MTRWRLAARLAWRELRAHKARTLLVVLMVGFPVLATQTLVVALRTHNAADSRRSTLSLDGADQSEGISARAPIGTSESGSPLPAGTRVVRTYEVHDWSTAPGRDANGDPKITPIDALTLVTGSPRIDVVEGRLPKASDEVAATSEALQNAGSSVGDSLHLVGNAVTLRVVGEVHIDGSRGKAVAVVGPPSSGSDWMASAARSTTGWREGESWALAHNLYWFPGGTIPFAFTYSYESSTSGSAAVAVLLAVVGTIGFLVVVCSTAFTIGARRRLRSLGTMSSAGATPADLWRAVLLEGTLVGALAAAAATIIVEGGAIVVYLTGLASHFESGLDQVPLVLVPLQVIGIAVGALVIGTGAALGAARTASHQPPLAALAGRRPLPRIRARRTLVAMGLFVAGTAILVRNTRRSWRGGPPVAGWVAVIALISLMTATVLASAPLVEFVGRFAARTRGTMRLALRGLSRDRTRSASVIAVVAVALAIPVATLTWAAKDADRATAQQPAYGLVRVDGSPHNLGPAVASVRKTLGPKTQVMPTLAVNLASVNGSQVSYTVMTPDQVAFGGFAPDVARRVRAALEAGQAVQVLDLGASGSWEKGADALFVGGRLPALVQVPRSTDPTFSPDRYPVAPAGTIVPRRLVTAGAIQHHRIGALLARDRPITNDEDRALRPVGERFTSTYATVRAASGAGANAPWSLASNPIIVRTNSPGIDDHRTPVLVAVPTAVLFALLVVAIALALAAADGRSDERLLMALGAPPALRRRRRVAEAMGLTGLGALLALVLGLVPTLTTYAVTPASVGSLQRLPAGHGSLPVPYLPLALLGVGAVLVVGGVVWIVMAGGEVFRRRRPLFLDP